MFLLFLMNESLKITLVKHFLRIINEKGTIVSPDEQEGIYFIKEAWYLVRAETIFNCWKYYDIMPEIGLRKNKSLLSGILENF